MKSRAPETDATFFHIKWPLIGAPISDHRMKQLIANSLLERSVSLARPIDEAFHSVHNI